jgi:hypothetical protein
LESVGIRCAYVCANENNSIVRWNGSITRKTHTKEIKSMKKLFILLAVLGGMTLASGAYANSLTLVNDTPPTTGGFDWNYHVDWANSTLNNGDFVTISSGVGGVVNGTVVGPAGWVGSNTATSVTWTWNGGTLALGSGQGTITGFTYHSTFGTGHAAPYNSKDQVNSGLGAGLDSTVTGFVSAPNSLPDGGSAVTLLGIAMAGIEGARRLLRRKA